MNKISTLIITCVLLTSCTSNVSSFKEVKKKGEDLLAEANEAAGRNNEFQFVRYDEEFFVPELKVQDQDKPSWFFKSAEGSFIGYSLSGLMADVVTTKGVNIRYLDNLDVNIKFSLSHNGTLGELLEKISFATKYSYSIDGDLLTWSKFQTKEFDVSFIGGTTGYMFGDKENGGQSGENSASGGLNAVVSDTGFSNSDEYVNFSTTGLSVWDDLEKTIKLLKSDEGEYVINQATSTVVVKDYPDAVSEISKFLENGNNKLTQNVAVDLHIIEYTANESDQYGVNWSLIKNEISGSGVLGFSTAFRTLVEDDLAPTILGFTKQTGKYAGSQILLNALERYGVVTSVKKRRITGLNNQVAKLIKGGELGYLAQSGGTSTANVGSQDNLIPGILKTGDTIYMLPNAVKEKVVIQLSTRLSTFKRLRDVQSGSRAIETPETNSTELFLKFAVKDGQTLLLSGSSDKSDNYNENSTLGVVALGGELGGKKSRSETLILITPRVIHL